MWLGREVGQRVLSEGKDSEEPDEGKVGAGDECNGCGLLKRKRKLYLNNMDGLL